MKNRRHHCAQVRGVKYRGMQIQKVKIKEYITDASPLGLRYCRREDADNALKRVRVRKEEVTSKHEYVTAGLRPSFHSATTHCFLAA